jgi:hypothetical protein
VRALCVARHRFLSEHFGVWFGAIGIECSVAVGLDEAMAEAAKLRPDVVLCEYDLLATAPLDDLERDPVLSRTPILAVSLTRRPSEMHLLDVNGIAGLFYLPALAPDDARRVLAAASRPVAAPTTYSLPASFEWTHTNTTAR